MIQYNPLHTLMYEYNLLLVLVEFAELTSIETIRMSPSCLPYSCKSLTGQTVLSQ